MNSINRRSVLLAGLGAAGAGALAACSVVRRPGGTTALVKPVRPGGRRRRARSAPAPVRCKK